MDLFAKRVGTEFDLFERQNGIICKIGKIIRTNDGRTVFVSHDDELTDAINGGITDAMRLGLVLMVVRDRYEKLRKDRLAESEAEHSAETAWLRAAEYAPDQLAEMEHEDIYCV